MFTKYLDPKNGQAFKSIFGTEKHKNILIHFLNAVLDLSGENEILDLEFLTTQYANACKDSVVGVLVKEQKGSDYTVEMKFEKTAGPGGYSCFRIEGNFAYFNRIVLLTITDFVLFPDKAGYKSNHITMDMETHECDLEGFSYTFIELPKFTKTIDQLTSIEEKWCYFLKHADESENISGILANHPEIKEAYEVLKSI